MKNIDKVKKLNADALAFILMCPGEFDNSFNRDEKEDEFCCHEGGKGCTECIRKWLDENCNDGFDYLKENETERKLEYNNKVKEVTKKEEPFIEKGQEYFCIDSSTFEIKNYYYIDDDDTDKKFLECGNIFPFTEESREEVYKEVNLIAEKRKLQSQMEQFARLNNKDKIDWNNCKQEKLCLFVNRSNNEIGIEYIKISEELNTVYFTSKEVAEKALEKFEDRIRELYIDSEDAANESTCD